MDILNLEDERWNLVVNLVLLFNVIPVFIFITYVMLTSMIIISSALLAELVTVVFGLALLLPVVTFCTFSALFIGVFLLILTSFLQKPMVKNLSVVQSSPTIEASSSHLPTSSTKTEEVVHSD